MRDGELEQSLVSVIGGSGGKDLLKEAAEFALDSVLREGVLKDIPLVGTVADLYSMAIGVQGYVFAKKVRRFLVELATIPKNERDEFASRMSADEKERTRVSETLVVLLDKLDDMEKSTLLARAFSGYVREEFDLPTFRRLAAAVDHCLVADLRALEELKKKAMMLEPYVGDVLAGAGLVSVEVIPTIRASDVNNTYAITQLGRLFLQVVVKGLPRDDD